MQNKQQNSNSNGGQNSDEDLVTNTGPAQPQGGQIRESTPNRPGQSAGTGSGKSSGKPEEINWPGPADKDRPAEG